MNTYPGPLLCEKLPDQVQLGISFAIDEKEVETLPEKSGQAPAYDYTFTIGQMIRHLARANVPILAVRWEITGGGPVANYAISQAAGIVHPLTFQMINQNPLFCAYTRPGDVVVGAYITTIYGIGYVQVTVQMTAPQVNLFEAHTEQVYVGPLQGRQWIRFGNPANPAAPGITINAVTYGAQHVSGNLGILQLAINMRVGTDADHRIYRWNLNGQAVLDVGPGGAYTFYQNAGAQLNPGGNAQFDITDSPASELGPPFSFLSIGDGDPVVVPETYRSYLMFRPNTAGSIYVPVSVLIWTWAGYSRLVDGQWSPVQDPENLINPVGVATHDFPVWNNNTNAGAWVQGLGANLSIRQQIKKEMAV